MKLIYIAGPFRGKTTWDVAENVRNAERAGLALTIACDGLVMPMIPHANTALFDGQMTGEFWLEGTLELLRRCDALYAIDGWERSTGARGEIAEANRLDIPVFYAAEEAAAWVSARRATAAAYEEDRETVIRNALRLRGIHARR